LVELKRRLRGYLPEGRPLPEREWRLRHRMILRVLILHVAGAFVYGLVQGFGFAHSALDAAPIAIAAVAAGADQLGRRLRSVVATLGLMTASAVLVHLSGGLTEFHFHFFVMLVVIIFYQDWIPFLVAVAFVALEHAVVGVLAPRAVYDHPEAWASPLKWAGVHALFVAGAAVGAVANWRITEKAQAAERVLADRLAYEASHDPLTGALNRRRDRCHPTRPARTRYRLRAGIRDRPPRAVHGLAGGTSSTRSHRQRGSAPHQHQSRLMIPQPPADGRINS